MDGKYDINANINSIILTDVFFFDKHDWFDISDHWSSYIVSGKTFRDADATWLLRLVSERLSGHVTSQSMQGSSSRTIPQGTTLYLAKHRIGQGAFRTLVADAYHRRCAITGERTVPVLQAAHLKAFSSEGPNSVDNVILLRSDMHALYDAGYVTIEYDSNLDPRVVVSKRLHDDFGNGKDYYPYHGKRLAVLPEKKRIDHRMNTWSGTTRMYSLVRPAVPFVSLIYPVKPFDGCKGLTPSLPALPSPSTI